jgi:protein gp37
MNRTSIDWTDWSWNPETGCSRGCYYCYARKMAYRLRGRCGYYQEAPFRPTWHGDKLLEPYYLKKPSKIFTCSMGELFDKDVPDIWRDLIFHVMWKCDWHIFQVLTKQAKRLQSEMMDEEYVPSNLWLGVSQDGKTTDPEDMVNLGEGS